MAEITSENQLSQKEGQEQTTRIEQLAQENGITITLEVLAKIEAKVKELKDQRTNKKIEAMNVTKEELSKFLGTILKDQNDKEIGTDETDQQTELAARIVDLIITEELEVQVAAEQGINFTENAGISTDVTDETVQSLSNNEAYQTAINILHLEMDKIPVWTPVKVREAYGKALTAELFNKFTAAAKDSKGAKQEIDKAKSATAANDAVKEVGSFEAWIKTDGKGKDQNAEFEKAKAAQPTTQKTETATIVAPEAVNSIEDFTNRANAIEDTALRESLLKAKKDKSQIEDIKDDVAKLYKGEIVREYRNNANKWIADLTELKNTTALMNRLDKELDGKLKEFMDGTLTKENLDKYYLDLEKAVKALVPDASLDLTKKLDRAVSSLESGGNIGETILGTILSFLKKVPFILELLKSIGWISDGALSKLGGKKVGGKMEFGDPREACRNQLNTDLGIDPAKWEIQVEYADRDKIKRTVPLGQVPPAGFITLDFDTLKNFQDQKDALNRLKAGLTAVNSSSNAVEFSRVDVLTFTRTRMNKGAWNPQADAKDLFTAAKIAEGTVASGTVTGAKF